MLFLLFNHILLLYKLYLGRYRIYLSNKFIFSYHFYNASCHLRLQQLTDSIVIRVSLIKGPARLHNPVVQEAQVPDCGIQMLMPQRLADHLQGPSILPADDREVPPQHMGRYLYLGLFLHPSKHVVDASYLQWLSCCLPGDIDEQEVLVLQELPIFRQIMEQEVESVIADAAPPVLGVLRPGVILIVIPEPHPDGMVLIINVPGIADPPPGSPRSGTRSPR